MQDILQASTFIYITMVTIREGSECSNVCLCRDTYAEAEYFTWNEGDRKCYCKPDNNLDVTRQDKSGRVSGNVQCDESV